MSRQIESVAVLGCGTMGSGIAAASAAAGCRVLMLDVTLDAALRGLETVDEVDRSRVITGTFDSDLALIGEYDWVCEAIVEDVATKQQLFAKVEPLRKDGSVVSSNTSGIPLRDIAASMGERFCRDVAITHFFNPVKVMKLFELVPGEQTTPDVIEAFANFGAERLNKGVVHAKDTVNFIGNRIGCYFMLSGLQLAKPFLDAGMTQETVNAVLGKPMGLPPTGLYGLIDLIGLDVMDLVGKNLAINLPKDDAGLGFTAFPPAEQRMLERGQLGRKARDLGGFSRVQKLADGTKRSETYDLVTEQWREATPPQLEGFAVEELTKPGAIMFDDSEAGRLAWQIFAGTLRYAAGLVPEIADDLVNIDNAIRWGFNWIYGPFELLDEIGPDRVIAKIQSEGAELPAMLRVLVDSGSSSFYRSRVDGTREYLGRDGSWVPIPSIGQ